MPAPSPPKTITIQNPARDSPSFSEFVTVLGCSRYDPPVSHWGATVRPTKLKWDTDTVGKDFKWANASTGIVHAYHGSHWGGWMFRVADFDLQNKTISLDPWGGQQEARGKTTGAEWHVENILEELDGPREWFLDFPTRRLFYKPNASTSDATVLPPSEVEVECWPR